MKGSQKTLDQLIRAISLLSIYPPKIHNRVVKVQKAGLIEKPDAFATEASFVCGSFVSLSLHIDRESSEILDAKYRTNGCGFMVAACEVVTEYLVSRHVPELHCDRPDELLKHLANELGTFPEGRGHCSAVVVDALKSALGQYREKLIDEYRGERALICTCFGIDEDTIENCIAENGLTTVTDVIDRCRAGGGCGSCQPIIQELIDAHR